MKTYIFMTGGIEGISGAIIYLRNKKMYLEENGWKVVVLYHNEGEVYVSDLDDCNLRFDFLKRYPSCYGRKRLNTYIKKLVDACGYKDDMEEYYIESHNDRLACWGEVLGKEINGVHIINILRENPLLYTKEYYRFLKFKLDRKEFFGMSPNTVQLFMKDYEEVSAGYEYQLKTPCDNTVADIESNLLNCFDKSADYHICTVTRLEKPYIPPMVASIIKFANQYQKKIQVFFIAGTYHEENFENVRKLFEGQALVKCYITGFMYPVPLKVLHKMDLAIGCAGSTLTTFYSGVPTISVDVSDFQPIGIMGLTTTNTHYRMNGEKIVPLEELIADVLIHRVVEPKEQTPDYRHVWEEFANHMEKLHQVNTLKKYYDVSRVINVYGKYKLRMFLSQIISPEFYEMLEKIKATICRRR